MNILSAIRSKLSGQTHEEFGYGRRHPLSKTLTTAIREHMNGPVTVDMSKFEFERRQSDYPEAKSDIVIYNSQGDVAYHGRENRDGRISIWP